MCICCPFWITKSILPATKNKLENQDKRNIYKEIQKLHKQLSQYLVWSPNCAPVSYKKKNCKVIEFSFCTLKKTKQVVELICSRDPSLLEKIRNIRSQTICHSVSDNAALCSHPVGCECPWEFLCATVAHPQPSHWQHNLALAWLWV